MNCAVSVEQPIALQQAWACGTPDVAGACIVHRQSAETAGPSTWSRIARLLWALGGVLTAVLTVAWVLWFNPHPLLGPGGPHLPLTCRTSLPAYAAALIAWGCFARALRR